MGLRAAKIAPYSSASRSKQLLCCFFAYLAKIDPIDFLKPLWLCGLYIVQTAAIFGSQTHTLHLLIFTSSWWQSFFFEVLSVISSINASGFGMELRQTIFFSFDEDLTSSSTWKKVDDDVPNVTKGGKFFLMFLFMFPHILMDRKWPRFNLLHTLFLSK